MIKVVTTIVEKIQTLIAFIGVSIWGGLFFMIIITFCLIGRTIAPCSGMGDCFPVTEHLSTVIPAFLIGTIISGIFILFCFRLESKEVKNE